MGVYSPQADANKVVIVSSLGQLPSSGTEFAFQTANSITAGTPESLVTVAAASQIRIIGFALSLSVAGAVIFKTGAAGATEVFRTPTVLAGDKVVFENLGDGILVAAPGANNDLFLDVTATGAVSGFIVYRTETP